MMPLMTVIATISSAEYPRAIFHLSDIVKQLYGGSSWRAPDVGDERAPTFSGQPRRAVSKLAGPKKWCSRSEPGWRATSGFSSPTSGDCHRAERTKRQSLMV